ncbi:anti-sigma factor domain-containing protein [Bacillus mexicanus]|uniref:anti-sigma factor domain-containing protein n=1 Tax=Bacillus mexicanus TaxID=2834415 RepID=UPI003D1F4199
MRRGIVLDKYNDHVAVMTPNRDFLKIKKDPLVCTIGEEIWFCERDIILSGIKRLLNKNNIQQLALHTFAISFIIVLFVFSGLITFFLTGDPKKLNGDFHSHSKQSISAINESKKSDQKECCFHQDSEFLRDVCHTIKKSHSFYKERINR